MGEVLYLTGNRDLLFLDIIEILDEFLIQTLVLDIAGPQWIISVFRGADMAFAMSALLLLLSFLRAIRLGFLVALPLTHFVAKGSFAYDLKHLLLEKFKDGHHGTIFTTSVGEQEREKTRMVE